MLMGMEAVSNYFPNLPHNRVTLLNLVWNPVTKGGAILNYFEAGLCTSPDPGFSKCLSTAVERMTDDEVQACWVGLHGCFDQRTAEFSKFMPALRKAFPTGSYVNEGDYFEPQWQSAFWGDNYERLRIVKRQVDPAGLLVCRHCVGSEDWTDDGNCHRGKRASNVLEDLFV